MTAGGPLAGVRVVELAGIGPAPFCGMLLSDLGADVGLVDRPGQAERDATAVTYRGRRHLVLDLKHPEDRDACLALIERADMLIEGFRPVSIGSIEPAFYAKLLDRLGIAADTVPDRADPQNWPAIHARFAECFACRPREEWNALLRDSDVCFAPILPMAEAPLDPHNAARGTFVTVDGVTQPAVAPRLGRTPGAIQSLGWERQPAEAIRRAWSQREPTRSWKPTKPCRNESKPCAI